MNANLKIRKIYTNNIFSVTPNVKGLISIEFPSVPAERAKLPAGRADAEHCPTIDIAEGQGSKERREIANRESHFYL